MANVLDYIDWRGDLSFDVSPVNEIDRYIFTCIGKPDLTGVVSSGTRTIGIKSALEGYDLLHPEAGDNLGLIASAKTMPALRKAAVSRRFDEVRLSGFVKRVRQEDTEQFSALTVQACGVNYISFRGTDDSIVGWKENCELAYSETIPAQTDALLYLEWAAGNYDGPLVVCGHSKGGNLAVYAACNASPAVQDRITAVFSYDGPGFHEEFFSEEGYLRMKDRITTVVPYRSFIGMLLDYAGTLDVVSAETFGVAGHDGFTWTADRCGFIHCGELSDTSKSFHAALEENLEKLNGEERRHMFEELFDALTSTGADMLSDFSEQGMRKNMAVLKNLGKSPEVRSFFLHVAGKSVKSTLGAKLDDIRRGTEEKGAGQ